MATGIRRRRMADCELQPWMERVLPLDDFHEHWYPMTGTGLCRLHTSV